MRRAFSAVLFAGLLALAPASGQSLLPTLPEDVLVYWRGGNALDAVKAFGTDTGLLKDPSAVDKMLTEGLDQMMAQIGEMAGIQTGSFSAWMRSVTHTEFVLYNLTVGAGAPDVDFVVAMETPMAEDIMATVTKLLTQANRGFDAGDGVTEIDNPDGQSLLVKRRGDLLVLAGSATRLSDTMSSFDRRPAKSLVASERYRQAVGQGDAKFGSLYVRLDQVMGIVQREMPPQARRTAGRVMTGLGVFNLRDMGYRESASGTEMRLTAEGEMPIFDLLAAPAMDAALMRELPSDTAIAYTWNGLPEMLWGKGSALFLDGKRFFFAPFAQEGVRQAQKQLGFTFEELTKQLDLGFTIGVVPTDDDGFDDESWFLSARAKDEDALKELARKALGGQAERRGMVFTETANGLWTEMRLGWPKTEGAEGSEEEFRPSREFPAMLSVGEGRLIIAPEPASKKVRAALARQVPTLDQAGTLKGIAPTASAYLYVGIGTFAHAFGMPEEDIPVARTASLVLSLDLSPQEIAIRSKQPAGMILSILPMFLMTARAEAVEVAPGETRPARERGEGRRGGRRGQDGAPPTVEPAPAEPTRPTTPPGGGGR